MKYLLTLLLLITTMKIASAQGTYWWNDKVFYEIFVRSYFDDNGDGKGDFKGLIKKLDYLNDGNDATTNDLGITAIWLMPIMESPSYHGYDVTDYRKIEQDYGTNADFKAFIDSAHARGIRVIIDFVLNHSASNNPWFLDSRSGTNSVHRNWYRWSATNPGYVGPWGQTVWHNYNGYYYYGLFNSGMPDLNYFEPAVKSEIANITRLWLDTLKVDGFRLDAAKYICEDGTKLEDAPSTFAFWREFRTLTKGIKADALSVGEVWSSTSVILPYVDGTGLDFCFEFDTANDIINAVNSGNPATLSSHILNRIIQNYPKLQYGTFLTNHDQTRVFSQLGVNTTKAKLAASLLLTLPGVPFIYYGEEIGMTSGSDDPSKRTPMQWTNGTNAGFTTGTPWKSVNANYITNNVQTMQSDENSLFSLYRKLIRLRNESTSLKSGNYYAVNVTTPGVFTFLRSSSNDNNIIIPLFNFSSSVVSNPNFTHTGYSGISTGRYKLVDAFTDADAGELYIQPNGDYNCTPTVTIAAGSSAILKASRITDVKDETVVVNFNLNQNYPNPFNPTTNISFQLAESGNVKLSVFNTLGEQVKVLVNNHLEKGYHTVEFEGKELNSGVYIYRLETDKLSTSRKMLLMK